MGKRKMYRKAPIICDGRDGMSFVLYIIGWISRAAVHFACTFGSSLFIADAFGITSPSSPEAPHAKIAVLAAACLFISAAASLASFNRTALLCVPPASAALFCAFRLASLRLGYRHVPHGGVGIRFVFLICLRPGILI